MMESALVVSIDHFDAPVILFPDTEDQGFVECWSDGEFFDLPQRFAFSHMKQHKLARIILDQFERVYSCKGEYLLGGIA